MDRFLLMQVIVAVAEEEGFAAAARRMQMSPPSVTRAISTLEGLLGVKLLNRSTRHVRASLDEHVSLEQLRELWRPISPAAYLDRKWPGHSLLVYARYDLTFPVDLSRTLVKAYAERGIAHDVAVLPCGHYSTGMTPFKFLDAYVLIRFLKRNL